MSEKTEEDGMNVLDMFANEAASSELDAGIHENVRLVSVSTDKRHDNNGNPIKKQLYLKFKKYDRRGEDIGEKEISFFLLDPTRDSVISNMTSFITQVKEILQMYYTNEEIIASFDPLKVLWTKDSKEEDFENDKIKTALLKKAAQYKLIEDAVCSQFAELVKEKIGFTSESFRFKLVETSDAKYIELPRYERFIERASVDRKESELLKG